MLDFTHRDYFRRFRLNVEQYGEILVAHAFRGIKMGDAQRGYDVKVAKSDFLGAFRTAGLAPGDGFSCFLEEEIRIEVKSKLSHTGKRALLPRATAEVLHLGKSKTPDGESRGQKHLGMTHLAVVLVYPGCRNNRDPQEEGLIADAWLLPRDMAVDMRNRTTREGKSLSVREIRAAMTGDCDIIDIKSLLESVAQAPLLEMLKRP